jgi:hypothetical protein
VATTLELVLAHVVPGRVVRLELSREQKRAFRDRDGRIALDALRHFLGARQAAKAPERFPLTPEMLQAAARKIGHQAGIKRCRAMRRRLLENGIIGGAGQYRQPYRNSGVRSGFRVRLYRLIAAAVRQLPPKRQLPVGKSRDIKRRSSPKRVRIRWKHPLFGDASGRPPPGLRRDVARKMRSLDERPAAATRVEALSSR